MKAVYLSAHLVLATLVMTSMSRCAPGTRGAVMRVSAVANCTVRCTRFGGVQAAYSDAEGAHCICLHP